MCCFSRAMSACNCTMVKFFCWSCCCTSTASPTALPLAAPFSLRPTTPTSASFCACRHRSSSRRRRSARLHIGAPPEAESASHNPGAACAACSASIFDGGPSPRRRLPTRSCANPGFPASPGRPSCPGSTEGGGSDTLAWDPAACIVPRLSALTSASACKQRTRQFCSSSSLSSMARTRASMGLANAAPAPSPCEAMVLGTDEPLRRVLQAGPLFGSWGLEDAHPTSPPTRLTSWGTW
mmetsp:Transcript_5751/g.11468  ORF Transcript_5751/g.11468 Transcript_5751/m.11468 type:complete len:238 (+) Transcript_5751:1410-2123(+)